MTQSAITTSASSITAGSTLTVTLTSLDDSGQPITYGGFDVVFNIAGGTSSGTFGAVTDNQDGTYTVVCTGTTAGTASTITATMDGSPVMTTPPTVTVQPGAATQLLWVTQPSGGAAGSAWSTQPKIRVADAQGNTITTGPDATAAITLSVSSGTGSLVGTTTVNAVAGIADFAGQGLNMTAAGSKNLRATKADTNGSGGTASFHADSSAVAVVATSPDSTNSTISASPTSVTADGSTTTTLTATLEDQYGNPISGTSVVFTSTGSANTWAQPSSATNTSGQTSGTLKSTAAGTKTITFTSPSSLTTSTTVTFTAGAASSTHSSISGTGPITANGTNSTITITLADANNNPISSTTPTFTSSGSNNTIGTCSSSNASGVSTCTLSSTTAETKTLTLNSPNTGNTGTVSFVPGAASSSHSSISGSGPVLADGTHTSTITITLADANNNPISNTTPTFSASGSNNTLGTCSSSDSSGISTCTLKSTTAEAKTLTLTSPNTGNTGSVTFVVVPAVAITSPANGSYINSATVSSFTISGSCNENGQSVSITATGLTATSALCSTTSWSKTLNFSSTSDGSVTITANLSDAYGNNATASSITLTKDSTAPTVTASVINNSAVFTGTPFVTVKVTASDMSGSGVASVRIANANASTSNCQGQYADDSWNSFASSPQSYSFTLPVGDGTKKICAWAKDTAGNVSTITSNSNAGTLGVDAAQISLQTTPPNVTSFSVSNGSGGNSFVSTGLPVSINWTLSSTVGLNTDPVKLEYSTDNTNWTTITSAYGGLSGNPSTYTGSYPSFNSPSTSYFIVRITPKDMAGNVGTPVVSQPMNTGNWSVYAGNTSRGVGANAKAAVLSMATWMEAPYGLITVNPTNNDVFVSDSNNTILQVSASTGIATKLIGDGANNLPSNGTLPASPTLSTRNANMAFDSNGLLYIGAYSGSDVNSVKIYQINPSTGATKLYVGGGTAIDNTATPSTAYVNTGHFTLDEDNTLYFTANCTPGSTWTQGTSTGLLRLMKVTQNTDGTPGTVSVVAGDCSTLTQPVSGTTATSTSFLHNTQMPWSYSLAVWNHGNTIYYGHGSTGVTYKILNGKVYSTAVPSANGNVGLVYDSVHSKLYVSAIALKSVTPNLSGAGGETSATTVVSSSGTGNCLADGILPSNACVKAGIGMAITPNGTLLFGDGNNYVGTNPYRVRYVGTDGYLQTLAGSLPFYGDGADKSVMRGFLGSIYYKQASEGNQAAFPEGLYFQEDSGGVFGYIDPSTSVVSNLWGTQQLASMTAYSTGTAVSSGLSMGSPAPNGNNNAMTFDNQGLPWIAYNGGIFLASLDANKKIVERTSHTATAVWDYATAGTAASASTLSYYGWESNITLKGDIDFLLGRRLAAAPYTDPNPVLRIFDYGADLISNIMGDTGTTSTADHTGSVLSDSISSTCQGAGCRTFFYENDDSINTDDVLYFTEGTKLRSIIDPIDNDSNTSLNTVFTSTVGAIAQIILSPDHSQIFYIANGFLYCHDISSGKSWCNDSKLGPPTGMARAFVPLNSLTWKDNSTLLMSTTSQIYQYTLLP